MQIASPFYFPAKISVWIIYHPTPADISSSPLSRCR